MTNEDKIRKICQGAILKAKGDTQKAYEIFNYNLTQENSAELERELTIQYRPTALRAWIAESYQILRSQNKIPSPQPTWPIKTTNYENPSVEKSKLKTGDLLHIAMQPSQIIKRYLDSFKVNGEPIGDCTAEIVLHAADNHERDTKFMRYLASGVPLTGKIRDYKTEDEATELWNKAQELKS